MYTVAKIEEKKESRLPNWISLSSSFDFSADGSKVVTTHPSKATIEPIISYLVTGFIVANLRATIKMEQRLEKRFA
jgi:hypothetical protein